MSESAIKLSRRNTADVNQKMKEKAVWANPEMKEFRESMIQKHGIDIRDQKKMPMGIDPNFSWGAFKKKVMRETNSASMNTQLLRAGVQTAVNNLYPAVKTTYEQWAHVIPSGRDTELYAPLNALTFLEELGEGERYAEASVVGLDIKLRNKKFGEMFPVSFELIDDDQTGQFAQKVGDMADYAAQLWEVMAYGKLNSIAAGSTYAKLKIPASETKPSYETLYPWNPPATPLRGGGTTTGSSAVALIQANVQTAFTALENQLNLQGLKMAVNPDKILISPFYRWTLATLLNSNFYPSGAAAAGSPGGALAINVLQGIAEPVISRFMFDQNGSANANSKAWYVMDSSKPAFIVQIREAAKITQENPESGAGFERDIFRWKLSVRGNADFIDPRFFYQGSDGSV
jgi:phage major head subunit gpT-like protein